MDQTIDVLVVEPGEEPWLTTVVDDLEHLQEIVGGPSSPIKRKQLADVTGKLIF